MVVLNSRNDANATFGYDTNKISIINDCTKKKFPLKLKTEVANDIVTEIENLLPQKSIYHTLSVA